MWKWLATVALSCAASIGAVACKECNSVGCQNGPVLNFSPALFATGNYAIAGTLDGEAFTCNATVEAAPVASCSKSQVHILFGSQPPSIAGISVDGTPARVTVEARRDGKLIASGEAAPTYQDLQPNGEGCDPKCRFSEETLSLSVADGGI
jgi:hypothetical protein